MVDERDLLIQNAKYRILAGMGAMNDLAGGTAVTGMSPTDLFNSALAFLDKATVRTKGGQE